MKWIIVLATLIALGHSQDPECPNPVECLKNPCQDEICPRFLNARCVPDNCHGECRAVFYHRHNPDSVISQCEVETCAQKTCHERRQCMEEVSPTNCPENNPKCRQFLRAVCELPPKPNPPSDCSVVQCGPGMVCEVHETERGRRARCVEARPTNCAELKEEFGPCDPGMACHFRPRNGKHSIVRCVPVRMTPRRPRNCSEVECMEGSTCMLLGAEGRERARCVRDKPQQPKSCKDLKCEEIKMICDEQSGEAMCRPPKNCSEVDCGTRECVLLNIPDIPIEFRCPFNEARSRCKLEMLTKVEGGRLLACSDPTLSLKPCSEVVCPSDKVCAGKVFPGQSSEISVCTTKEEASMVSQIATCDTVPDDFCGTNEACIDAQQGDYRGFAHCTQINCNDTVPCTETEDMCHTSNARLLDESGVSHSCAPADRVKLEEDGTCAGGRSSPCNANTTTCTEFRMNNALVGTGCIPPFRLPTRECSQLSCEAGEECAQDMIKDRVLRATCESSPFITQLLNALRELNL